jgi:hypothetical protein
MFFQNHGALMEWLPFWTEALLLPLLGLGGNTAIRWSLDLEQSAAADLVMLFAVFDGVLILRADSVYSYSVILASSHAFEAWFVAALFLNLIMWFLILVKCEVRLRPLTGKTSLSVLKRAGLILVGLLISMFVITYNTVPFTVRAVPW